MIMNVNDLSIGNLVMADDINQLRVDEILWFDHLGYTLRMWVGINRESKIDLQLHNAKPIPLTEEILLSCGLDKVGLFYVAKDDPPRPSRFLLGKVEGYCYIEYRTRIIKIRYLHQLQNINFALTRKELNIML
jgi:hypothetical protein